MAHLGILEGRFPIPARSTRSMFGGTLASSRARRTVGPTLFGADEGALSTWIYNAKSLVNQKWAKIESDQVLATGKPLDAGQKAAWAAELVRTEAEARAAFAAQSAGSAPPPAQNTAEAGALSTAASQAAGRGRAAESTYREAKAAALTAALPEQVAESIAKAAASAVASGLSYDYGAAIAAAVAARRPPAEATGTVPGADVTRETPMPALMTQEQLRRYFDVPAESAASSPTSSAPAPTVSPQELLRHTYAEDGATSPAPAPASGRSLLVPIAALAAAYFFLKG